MQKHSRSLFRPTRRLAICAGLLWISLFAACEDENKSAACAEDSDCPDGMRCLLQVCRTTCTVDDDCPARKEVCHSGVCLDGEKVPLDAAIDSAPPRDAAPGADTIADTSADSSAQPDSQGPSPDTTPPDPFCQGSDVVLAASLTSAGSGQVSGGSFSAEGWTTSSTSDQIYWDLGSSVSAGWLELEIRGLRADVPGCLLGVCYYLGLFEEDSGDKKTDYSGSAFIESRFHTDQQENFHDTIKLQSGTGAGDMSEFTIDWPVVPLGWSANEWHTIQVSWDNGTVHLGIDGAERVTTSYGARPDIPWRHLFVGTTNYKGMDWGAIGITYRNLCVRRY